MSTARRAGHRNCALLVVERLGVGAEFADDAAGDAEDEDDAAVAIDVIDAAEVGSP